MNRLLQLFGGDGCVGVFKRARVCSTRASLRHSSFVLIIPLLRCVMLCSYYTKFKRKGKLISLPSDPNTVVGVGRTITGIISKASRHIRFAFRFQPLDSVSERARLFDDPGLQGIRARVRKNVTGSDEMEHSAVTASSMFSWFGSFILVQLHTLRKSSFRSSRSLQQYPSSHLQIFLGPTPVATRPRIKSQLHPELPNGRLPLNPSSSYHNVCSSLWKYSRKVISPRSSL